MEIAIEEGTGGVGLFSYGVNMRCPLEFVMEFNPEVFSLIYQCQFPAMDKVIGSDRGLFPGKTYDLTLVGIKFHQPPLLPALQAIQVVLERDTVIWRIDDSVQQAVVCK